MNRKKKDVRNKSLLAAVNELDDLRRISRNAPWIKLPKPIQTGFLKTLDLRDDCKNRSDAHIYKEILEKVKINVFCRKQDFIDKKGFPIKAGVRLIRTNEWEKIGWPDFYKKHFVFGMHEIGSSYFGGTQYAEGYKFWQRYYFVDKIHPHFITHTQAKLPEVETRIAELDAFIRNNGGWDTYWHFKRGRVHKERDLTQPRFDMIEEFAEDEIKNAIIYDNV